MAGDTRDIRINVTVDSDTRGSQQAAAGLEKVDKAAGDAEGGLAGLRKESEKLDVQLAKSKTKVHELEQELIRTGDRTTGRGSLRSRLNQERSWLRELERTAKSAADAAAEVGPELVKSFDLPRTRVVAIGALVGLAATAAPLMGAIIGGAIAGTTVGGGIAGGVIAASSDSRVRAAFHDLADEFTAEAFGGGAFVAPVVEGLHILKDEFANLGIDEALAKGASSVPILADGIAGLVANVMPGFNDVMDKAEAFTVVFADGLKGTGSAVSYLLSRLVKSEGTIEGLAAGFKVLNGVIVGTGNVLGWLADRFHSTLVVGAAFTGGMEDIVRGAENVARSTTQFLTFGAVNLDNNHHLSDSFAQMNDNLEDTEDAGYGAGNSLAQFIDIIRNGLDPTESQAAALKKVNDEFERQIDLQSSLILDQLDVEEGLQNLADLFVENGTDLSSFTDAGRENQRALVALAKEMRQVRDDQIELTGDTYAANVALEANKERLYAQAEAAGISRAEVERLIGALLAVPALTYADIVVNRTYSEGTSGGEGRRAAGGFVSAGMSYKVGEYRPEIFTPKTNGYISPSVGAWSAGMGSGGGGGVMWAQPLVVQGGPVVDMEKLREEIKARGGTLAVLGLRAN